MFEESLAEGRSFLHTLDPRVKIIVAFAYAMIVALSSRLSSLIWAGLFVGILLGLAQLGPRRVLRQILLANYFILLLVLVLPFTYPGKVLYSFGPFSLTKEGAIYALTIFLKSNLILTCLVLLLSTTSVFTLAHALHHLHVSEKLVQLIFFSFRYVHVIHREYQKLMAAIKLRGFVPRTNFYTYKTYAYLVASLLIKSYDRSERVYKAMLCRGFKGVFPTYRHFKMQRKDKLFALGAAFYLVFLAFWTF